MTTIFKIKYYDNLGDKYRNYLSHEIVDSSKDFEEDILECIKKSKEQNLVSIGEGATVITALMIEDKGYKHVDMHWKEYQLEDNCPIPNSIYLTERTVMWKTIEPKEEYEIHANFPSQGNKILNVKDELNAVIKQAKDLAKLPQMGNVEIKKDGKIIMTKKELMVNVNDD